MAGAVLGAGDLAGITAAHCTLVFLAVVESEAGRRQSVGGSPRIHVA